MREAQEQRTPRAIGMKLQEVHNRIRGLLAQLSLEVKGASAMGQTDIHRLSEIVVHPVLKITLKLPALRNLNAQERQNFPGIDLGDSQAGVGIQVTASADASKIRDTIKKCIRHGIYETYPHLRFFVLTEKQSTYGLDLEADLDGKMTFDPRADVLDYTDILRIVSTLGAAEAATVAQALEVDLGLQPPGQAPPTEISGQEPGWLNLLPVTFPSRMYLGELIPEARPKRHARKRDARYFAKKHLGNQGLRFSSDWTVYGGQVITFHDLSQRDLPLAQLVDAGTVTELATGEYHDIDHNYQRAFKGLLRWCLQQLLFQRKVFWQHEERLFCFGPSSDGDLKRYVSWADKKNATREVFKRVPKRDTPDETYHCKHLAFRAAFHALGPRWYASLKPEWFFSFDGYRRWAWGAERINFLKRKEKNQTVFNHVKFLAHFLRRQAYPNLFREAYPFLTFGRLESLRGLPEFNDDAWRSDEAGATGSELVDPEGLIPLELEDV